MARIGLAAACLLAALALPARSAEPPPPLAGIPGVLHVGAAAGFDVWTVPGSDLHWLVAPDGRGLVAGRLFSAAGADLGAALSGEAPVSLQALLAPASPAPAETADEDPAATPEAPVEPAPVALDAEALITAGQAGFALEVGPAEAPLVIAWIDPTVPDPRIAALLRAALDGGPRLRLLPTPARFDGEAEARLVDLFLPEAPGRTLVASILEGPPPRLEGGLSTIPFPLLEGLVRNRAVHGSVPGAPLPLFAWRDAEGVARAGAEPPDFAESAP